MSKIIGIDVDLTVCAIDELWREWLTRLTRYEPDLPVPREYNISTYWQLYLDIHEIDGLEFFRSTHLYDMAKPIPLSGICISQLRNLGYEVVFISAVKGNHHKSKYEWLKRNFEFDGFIATQEKQYINCDIMIDDRNKFLNLSKAPVKIKISTPYTQCEELEDKENVVEFNNWADIYDYIKEL